MKHGKKYRESLKKYDSTASYDLLKACETVKEIKFSNFDETVEAHVNLKLSKSQTVRDTLVFPNQFKGEKKVLVFCKEDRIKEALDAGAAFAGGDKASKMPASKNSFGKLKNTVKTKSRSVKKRPRTKARISILNVK